MNILNLGLLIPACISVALYNSEEPGYGIFLMIMTIITAIIVRIAGAR